MGIKLLNFSKHIVPILILGKLGWSSNFANANGNYIFDDSQNFDSTKINGKKLTPSHYTVIEYQKGGTFKFLSKNDEYQKSNLLSHCMLESVSKEKIEYYHKINLGKEVDYNATEKKVLSSFFLAARVDLLISIRDKEVKFYPWNASDSTFIYKLEQPGKEPGETVTKTKEDAINTYCKILNYNGYVVRTKKNLVYIKTALSNLGPKSQASVYGNLNKNFATVGKNYKASAILKYVGEEEGLKLFKTVIGNSKPWDKVFISETK